MLILKHSAAAHVRPVLWERESKAELGRMSRSMQTDTYRQVDRGLATTETDIL